MKFPAEVVLRLDDQITPVIKDLCQRLETLTVSAQPSVSRALLGAAAAATQLKAKVSRRELFMPWTRRG